MNEPAKSPSAIKGEPSLFRRLAELVAPQSARHTLMRVGEQAGLRREDSSGAGAVQPAQVTDVQSMDRMRRNRGALLASLTSLGSAA